MNSGWAVLSTLRAGFLLVGLGVTIIQFFGDLGSGEDLGSVIRAGLSRYVALVFIGTGTFALAIAVWEYRALVGRSRDPAESEDRLWSSAMICASLLVALGGLLTICAMLLRSG